MQCGRLRSERAADLHHQLSRLHCRGGHCCRRSSARPGPALRLQADYPMWTRRTRRHLWLIRASSCRRRCPLSRPGGSKQSVSFQPSLLIWQCSAERPRRVDRRSSTSRPRTAGSRPFWSLRRSGSSLESGHKHQRLSGSYGRRSGDLAPDRDDGESRFSVSIDGPGSGAWTC